MNVKTMEGLSGASSSIQLLSTPMRVAEEAERKGDTDKMKRAMGYAAGLTEQAEEYSKTSAEGMKLDAKEAKKEEELRQEELIQARKEEREELEKRIEAERQGETAKTENGSFDSVEISETGKLKTQTSGQDSSLSVEGAEGTQHAGYDKSGEAVDAVSPTGENVNISV